MKNTNANTRKASSLKTAVKAKLIKLGINVHAESYRVVRQIDNDTPQPAQKFIPTAFLVWVAKQIQLAEQVHSCYEAGPFGYSLHRQLLEMGVRNRVVRPQNWDELGRKVKTDKTDALALAQRLDRYVQGNRHALAVITPLTPEQEQARCLSRHRQQLQKDRQTHEAQGRSFLLYHGRRVSGQWWQPKAWEVLSKVLEPWQSRILESLRALILLADQQLAQTESQVIGEAQSPAKGFGALTSQLLRCKVLDWRRFKNRRQVASLTGMCPSVRASGGRKKAAVAIGRRLVIDLWRMETGRATATQLYLS
jgi:transposase